MDTTAPSPDMTGKDALIRSLREELAVTNQGMIALTLELGEKMQELELLNEELKSFSYSVSHDLRQPLRAVDGFTRILQKDYAQHLDEEGKDYMTRIRGGVARMNAMIDGLLVLSSTIRKEIIRQEVYLDTIAQAVLADLKESDPGRQVQVHIDSGMRVSADAQMMESVVQNLFSNAWKYSARQPIARIAFRREEIGGEKVYVVEDNGAGFDMRQTDRLFCVFQRLHSAGEFEGAGIGLATTQRIIRRHGGRIWARGKPGEGARFMFTLPDS